MKNIVKGLLVLIFLSSMIIEAKEPRLDKGEKNFNPGTEKSDYNLDWNVNFLTLLSMYTKPYNEKKLSYKESVKEVHRRFWSDYPSFSIGNRDTTDIKMTKNAYYLMNVLLQQKYFWKYKYTDKGKTEYKVIGLLFKDNSKHLKAIETLDEVKSMLGDIDTPSELFLWIYASTLESKGVYSYKKIGNLYRVRYVFTNTSYFKYYDKNGHIVKTEILKR